MGGGDRHRPLRPSLGVQFLGKTPKRSCVFCLFLWGCFLLTSCICILRLSWFFSDIVGSMHIWSYMCLLLSEDPLTFSSRGCRTYIETWDMTYYILQPKLLPPKRQWFAPNWMHSFRFGFSWATQDHVVRYKINKELTHPKTWVPNHQIHIPSEEV